MSIHCHNRLRTWTARAALHAVAVLLSFGEAMAQDNAAIFFFGPAPSVEQVAAAARGAHIEIRRDGDIVEIAAEWRDATLRITVDPPRWKRDVQLSGIRAWISKFPSTDRGTSAVQALLSSLDRTTTCYGSVTTPAFDQKGKVVATLLRLLQSTGGFFFAHQSFYDAGGKKIIGLPNDPQRLGSRL